MSIACLQFKSGMHNRPPTDIDLNTLSCHYVSAMHECPKASVSHDGYLHYPYRGQSCAEAVRKTKRATRQGVRIERGVSRWWWVALLLVVLLVIGIVVGVVVSAGGGASAMRR